MGKNELLDKLFDEWENKIPEYKDRFVRDGINDELEYDKASVKILFITKEANNPEQLPDDTRNWWKDGVSGSFGRRLAQWSFGILNNFPEFDSIGNRLKKSINQTAFMNIKKSGGKGNADHEKIIAHLKFNIDFLYRQIKIINPDLIITGLSGNYLRDALFPTMKETWRKSGYDIEIGKFNNAKVIDFYHPSVYGNSAGLYCLLKNIIQSSKFMTL